MTEQSPEELQIPPEIEEEFRAELQAGRNPSIEQYARRIPELFDEIHEYLEILLFTERAIRRPRNEESLPEQIGEYPVTGLLGKGGMGRVYRALHPNLDREVAIKVLPTDTPRFSLLRERFEREAAAAAALDHPNLVSLYDFEWDDDSPFLVMQLINGTPLSELLNNFWEDESDAVDSFVATDFHAIARMGADVASALNHVHQAGTFHRDIKPANLILDNDGKVWVTDFGLAKLRDEESELSSSGDMIGTPRYMAPEQIRGNADERSDIYSLGVTLWEFATGKRAWDAVNQSDLVSVKASFELPKVLELNADVPSALADIIDKACAFDPDERYRSARELQHALNSFSHGGNRNNRRRRDRHERSKSSLWRETGAAALLAVFCVCGAVVGREIFSTRGAPSVNSQRESAAVDASLPRESEVSTDRFNGTFLGISFIQFEWPLARDGVYVQVAGGRDGASLIVASRQRTSKRYLPLLLHPDSRNYSDSGPKEYAVELTVSSQTAVCQASISEETGSHRLIWSDGDRDSGDETCSLTSLESKRVIDVASHNGSDFFGLFSNPNNRLSFARMKRMGDLMKVESYEQANDVNHDTKGIATADGQTFFAVEQSGGTVSLVILEAVFGSELKKVWRIDCGHIPEEVEGLSTVDGKCFTIIAKRGDDSVHYTGGLFDESTFSLSIPNSQRDAVTAATQWVKAEPDSTSVTVPLIIRMPAHSGSVHIGRRTTERFLGEDTQRNVLTRTTPTRWRMIHSDIVANGHETVRFQNMETGMYLDDDGSHVDTAQSPYGVDKLWELIPQSSGRFEIRNVETRTYLFEEFSDNRVTSSPLAGCEWSLRHP